MQNGSMITSVAFTLDGKTACAGTHNGQCFFYETQGLKYNTQINIRFGKRTSKKSRKITGIEPMPGTLPGDERILITSNDSQARLYNMKDKSLMYKYKGPHNLSMQIRSSFRLVPILILLQEDVYTDMMNIVMMVKILYVDLRMAMSIFGSRNLSLTRLFTCGQVPKSH